MTTIIGKPISDIEQQALDAAGVVLPELSVGDTPTEANGASVGAYRDRSVVVAWQLNTVQDASGIAKWTGGSNERAPLQVEITKDKGTSSVIVEQGDYVVRLPDGEFIVMTATDFAECFEAVA